MSNQTNFPIATHPAEPRDHCKLLVLDRKTGRLEHLRFYDIIRFLNPGDCLVLNNSKVFPARILFKSRDQEGELLLVQWPKNGEAVLAKTTGKCVKRLREDGGKVLFKDGSEGKIHILDFVESERSFLVKIEALRPIEELGSPPLPPYILKTRKSQGASLNNEQDARAYQCVYAKNRGSIAAPTAGMHWTDELLNKVRATGVNIAEITLHIGLASMMKADDAKGESLPAEFYEMSQSVAELINITKASGKKVIACGTSAVRTLETLRDEKGFMGAGDGATELFIKPGYVFKAVDSMITNFHLPDATNFLLTQSFAGESIDLLATYREAASLDYRFFSYGDAMLIL